MNNILFPPQQLPESKKGKKWRRDCVDFADSKLHYNYSFVRLDVIHKKINYDLVTGKLHMDDLQLVCNPEGIKAGFIPDNILHYTIMNSKLNVLRGEELGRLFDYRVIVTNPNAISEVEEHKKLAILLDLLKLVEDQSQSELEFQANYSKLADYYTFLWQDFKELLANCLLRHYNKEYNIPLIFNEGFNDGLTVGEEIYLCSIVGGEPVLERINPMKIRVFKSGYSNRIEDADMIILEDYWSPGKVYDVYYDLLSPKDLKYIEEFPDHFSQGAIDGMDNVDERFGFVNANMVSDTIVDSSVFFDPLGLYSDGIGNDLLPFDLNGNIRVIRIYWKSRRMIKKVKYYDPETGEEEFTFMPESYTPNIYKGESEETFWINEAWEGTKIGEDIYVGIQPRVVLYNVLDNPSRCHFGIVGTIYNLNDDRPYSMVDMMKPFAYLYDIIFDRLNKMMARNWGKMTRLDFAKKPNSWSIEKWLYYAKTMGLFVEDSFNAGLEGAALGKIAGGLNSNSLGVIDADFGNNIQQYINLLEFIKLEMSDVAGISKQREGQISNRETVGGVERATLLSSHITEWIFAKHDDVRRRALEVFLETAKVAMRGRTKKFLYILPDYSTAVMEIDGDDFADSSYGLVVDNSNGALELNLKLETLAQAALLNLLLDFSTIMKLYNSASLAEKQRFVESDERRRKEEMLKQQQEQMLIQQQQIQANMQSQQEERKFKDSINQRDNETKVVVAQINSQAEKAILLLKNNIDEEGRPLSSPEEEENIQLSKDKLLESMRLFDERLRLDRERLEFDKLKAKTDASLKRLQIGKKTTSLK